VHIQKNEVKMQSVVSGWLEERLASKRWWAKPVESSENFLHSLDYSSIRLSCKCLLVFVCEFQHVLPNVIGLNIDHVRLLLQAECCRFERVRY